MAEEVIELSIAETQALRAKLGLAPLRFDDDNNNRDSGEKDEPPAVGNDKEISLSIDETNALRLKLGLAPLQLGTNDNNGNASKSAEAIHAPPTDSTAIKAASIRIQDAKDKRVAEDKLAKWRSENLQEEQEGESAVDFANKLRSTATTTAAVKKTKKKKKTVNPISTEEMPSYTSSDLTGLKVAHSASEFTSGTSTILTLSDAQILSKNNSKKITGLNLDNVELSNPNMVDDSQALENLKRKREIELGQGRAGGYAGFDDGEFEEFGGVEGRGDVLGLGARSSGKNSGGTGGKGFAIGQDGRTQINTNETKKDLFTKGAISLQSTNNIASDFITEDEMNESRQKDAEKEKKRQMKLLEKMRKRDKKKKDKKKNKRSTLEEESDDETPDAAKTGSLLESLEATAVKQEMRKKRRRDVDENDNSALAEEEPTEEQIMQDKRSKFDRIMEKGKMRTERAFKTSSVKNENTSAAVEEEEDDAFLNAALAKARRIQRLKELNGNTTDNVKVKSETNEETVLQAIDEMKKVQAVPPTVESGGITFENDEMQEFTRALRARADQVKRGGVEKRGVVVTTDKKKKQQDTDMSQDVEEVEDVDMQELANEMQDNDDDNQGGFDPTSTTAPIGRGLSTFLSHLRSTGKIKQHSTREEMRGRAKDKRTYDDYEQLNLDEVVKVNPSNAKDLELSQREIKLEYRDEHGRLLTRKEAYREMCYQFHGHGASKKNQERKMRQIEREREEASKAAARGGTMGALGVAQRATGKAFVVHKT